ncbi:Uncharacterized protein dnl_11640 [Desulfonema limicola]|uniref:Glycerophosphoryl diester phosphodiesterase membrane domain-containing protein n=1 Tax=Desulfonema limicola TaxID=45656 RepID=A0A975B508_9BACT|nr:hypothetical protein [Desulfonema limicola]QTA78916.1 Uncharacterized protein dnl_11640 [Desulfonema limicola]
MDFKSHLELAWKLNLQYIAPLILMTLVMAVAGFLSIGILAPVMMAGYMQSVLLMLRSGREPKVQDLFSEMRLFLPLLGFGVVVFIAVMIGLSFFFLPGIVIICGISFVCLYMMPLMTDRNYDVIGAVKESYKIVSGEDLMDHVIVAILFLGITTIGSSVFIGFLFTQPLATIFLLSVYEKKMDQMAVNQHDSENQPPSPRADQNDPDDNITLKYKA